MQKIKLGEILKNERKKQGLSLREFSAKLNISHTFLNKLERGTDPKTGRVLTPTIDTLTKIADGLSIPHKEFLEMCGYLDSAGKALPSLDYAGYSIDLDEFRTGIIQKFSTAECVVHEGRKLSADEINLLVNALIMSVDLVIKKGGMS